MKQLMKLKTLKKVVIIVLVLITTLTAQNYRSGNNKMYNISNINDEGVLLPNTLFVGTVHLNMVVENKDNLNSSIGEVRFDAKARSNWHTHTCGQILIVTDGIGYYQEKGKPIQVIKNGDVVKIPKDVEHWHGASHTSSMKHLSIVPSLNTDVTTWLKPVTDKEYNTIFNVEKSKIELTDDAVKNHDLLWPNYISKAKQTDPELIEVFDNFAFDEVYKDSDIDLRTRILTTLASTIATQSLSEYKMFVNAALSNNVSPVEVKEVLYQAIPYVGIAKVLDFIYTTNDIFKEMGIELPLAGQSTTNKETRFQKGIDTQKEIFGDYIDKLYENSPKDQIHIQKFLSANCFGDYYTRTGLDLRTRELLTYTYLISMGSAESQVKGHIQGNLNMGNDRSKLLAVTTALIPYIGYPRTLNAINAINEINSKK